VVVDAAGDEPVADRGEERAAVVIAVDGVGADPQVDEVIAERRAAVALVGDRVAAGRKLSCT
jgi:hypothetical protein